MFIREIKEKYRLSMNPKILIGTAQLALVLYFVIEIMNVPGLEFLSGILLGLSITGNLAGVIRIRNNREV